MIELKGLQPVWEKSIIDFSKTTASLEVEAPTKRELVFECDKPWEGDMHRYISIIYDEIFSIFKPIINEVIVVAILLPKRIPILLLNVNILAFFAPISWFLGLFLEKSNIFLFFRHLLLGEKSKTL